MFQVYSFIPNIGENIRDQEWGVKYNGQRMCSPDGKVLRFKSRRDANRFMTAANEMQNTEWFLTIPSTTKMIHDRVRDQTMRDTGTLVLLAQDIGINIDVLSLISIHEYFYTINKKSAKLH